MRLLVIYAHPVEGSFVSAVHRCTVDTLKESGHEVDDCDLYAEGFQPTLTREERLAYHDLSVNQKTISQETRRLSGCSGLVLIFPTWWYGMPAILKGYIDRVWLPGVAFTLEGGRTLPLLQNIVRFAVVTTYGSPWWLNKVMGDPNKRVLMRGISQLFSRDVRKLWLAQYGMDSISAASRQEFLVTIERRFREFCGTTVHK